MSRFSVTVLACVALLPGCGPAGKGVQELDWRGITVEKIRDCEYIVSQVNSGQVIHHAGDCRNPIHGEKGAK